MEVYKPGTTIQLRDGIKAIVLSVTIDRGESVSYEVVWWDGNVRQTEEVVDEEIALQLVDKDQVHKIGFKS